MLTEPMILKCAPWVNTVQVGLPGTTLCYYLNKGEDVNSKVTDGIFGLKPFVPIKILFKSRFYKHRRQFKCRPISSIQNYFCSLWKYRKAMRFFFFVRITNVVFSSSQVIFLMISKPIFTLISSSYQSQ